MRTTLKIVTTLFLAFLLLGCGEDDGMEPENLLDQVGFEGTLPDGSTFGTSDIRSGNGSGSIGINGVYQGYHSLGIRTSNLEWSLSIESPRKNLSNTPKMGENVPRQEVIDYFNDNYPYEEVLTAFLNEKSKADSDVSYTSYEQIRVQLANQKKYFAYLPEAFFPLRGGKVRVLAVNEGMIKDLGGNNIRKIEVTIEFDLPMKASDASTEILEGNLKGVGRFRYREDFYQGEFEKFD